MNKPSKLTQAPVAIKQEDGKPPFKGEPTPAAEAKPTKIRKIKVLKQDAKFRGAREAWYAELKKFDGKPLKDYEEACAKKPPSLPKSGRAEAPSGWTSYFKRTGILEITEVEA